MVKAKPCFFQIFTSIPILSRVLPYLNYLVEPAGFQAEYDVQETRRLVVTAN